MIVEARSREGLGVVVKDSYVRGHGPHAKLHQTTNLGVRRSNLFGCAN